MNRKLAVRLAWRPVLATLSGVLLALAFPPIGLAFLAPVAVGGLTVVAVNSRLPGSIAWSLWVGFVFNLVLFRWISVIGEDAWIGLTLYCTVWFALVGFGTWCVARLPWWPVWVASCWVLTEALRDRLPFGGFAWGRLAFSQAQAPDAGYAALAGAPLVTFAVALAGALLAWAAIAAKSATDNEAADRPNTRDRSPDGRSPRLAVAVASVAACLIWLGGLVVPKPIAGESAAGPAEATVAVIQGSVPGSGLDAMAQRRAVLDNHVAATLELARHVQAGQAPAPQLVVWPENSSDLDPLRSAEAADRISHAAQAIGVPILVGAVAVDPTNRLQRLNIGLVWDPVTGPGQYYVKRHPVPFGEYLPGRELLTKLIERFNRIPYDFAPGSEPGVLQVGPARIGDVICFEVADDSIVRDAVLGGGRALGVQTNNATFATTGWGGSAQPEQQFAMAQLRAVEHGRAVIVAATSGISAVIAPDGSVITRAPMFDQAELIAQVPLRDSLTVADRLGGYPELALSLLAAAAMAWGGSRRAAGRRTAIRAGEPSASQVL